MKKQLNYVPQRRLVVSAVLMALSGALAAQTASPAQDMSAGMPANSADQAPPGNIKAADRAAKKKAVNLQAIVVTGIRGSMESSMNLKRDSQGIVDGIVAEDIGKFPDTNLAEALQRISGVSIDRDNGEGSRVTVRGVGPDYNMVLLNGREMPSANINATSASSSRAFDFANLSAAGISQIDVYKTSRASTPEGGIGATINIRTARPFEFPGTHGSFTVKADTDESNHNLPSSMQGSNWTPDVAGIFSTTSKDGKWGFAINGSYMKRDSGFSQVGVTSGWRTFHGNENNWGTIPQPGQPGSQNITNRPGPNDIYSVPQNINYSVNGVKEERTNGQMVLQFKPFDGVVSTLDYTYSERKVHTLRNELSAWFNFGPSTSSWTNGPVAAPLVYSETINPANSDVAMAGSDYGTRNKNGSLGFNTTWKVNDSLNLGIDVAHSTATAGADSPFGSNNTIGTAGFVRGTTTVDFSGKFPVMNIQFPPGLAQTPASAMLVTGSSFRNSYMKDTIDQLQLSGNFTFQDYSRLDFGVGQLNARNRTAFSNVQLDTWGGATSAADYPDSVWTPANMANYFGQFSGAGSPNYTGQFFTWNFPQVRQLAQNAWVAAGHSASAYSPSPVFTTDQRTTEKSTSLYLQWSQTYDWNMPLDVAVGVRSEKTNVYSTALVPTSTGISWGSANEFTVLQNGSGFTRETGSYKYLLPSTDLALHLTPDMILRGSYGETIGRPTYDQIQGGQTLNTLARVNGGTGASGNPGLKPLHSRNFDLSYEWYYGEGSFVSVGFFRKLIDNYVGQTSVNQTPFNLHTPVGGAYWNAALGSGCATTDTVCIRDYILNTYNGQPGVTKTGVDSTGNATGTIVGQPGDPVAIFAIQEPANQKSASLDGWEFNIQQLLGQTGFGFSANYTIVKSSLKYNNALIGQQFALIGVSNSANAVGFYEKGPWQARVAYNWRGQFLSSVIDGGGNFTPGYTEPYGQVDVSIGYQYNKHLSFSLEGINVTDQYQRIHARTTQELLYLTQSAPRYMLGVTYKF